MPYKLPVIKTHCKQNHNNNNVPTFQRLPIITIHRFNCALVGGAENARLENAGLELLAPNCRGGKCMTGNIGTMLQGVENAGLELSGTGNVWNATCGIT